MYIIYLRIIFGATILYRYHDLDTLADFLFTASHPPRNINSDKELHSSIFILSREHNLSFLTSARLADQVKVVGAGLKSDFFSSAGSESGFSHGVGTGLSQSQLGFI